jgi:hypothetical protein
LDHRVVVIGGLAVIAHGLSRHTKDADIWLDPLNSPGDWADVIENARAAFPGVTIHRLPGWVEISGSAIEVAADETGMVRILGLSSPLDIFRRPNEFEEAAFEGVAQRARLNGDRTLLPDPLDLIQSKLETSREQDFHDIQFLESVIRSDYKKRLPLVSFDEAKAMLERFSDWQVLVEALKNPSVEVKQLAMAHLEEFAAAGDPFSQAILAGRELP